MRYVVDLRHPLQAPCGGDDTSFAMAIGGVLDLAVSHHIWVRAIQADYHYSELRNLQGNRQNQMRLSVGLVVRR
jgi:outer membrane immunogenic protein